MTGAAWEYVAVFASSLFLSLVLTPLMLRVAVRGGFLDHPSSHKRHEVPTPYLGGVVLVTAFSLAVVAVALANPPEAGWDELVVVIVIAVGLSLIGLCDDLWGLVPLVRIGAEIGAGLAVWRLGVGADLTGSETVDLLITLVWIVGICNAFNLLDNMDGLSAGVAAICAGSFFVIAVVNGQFLVAGLSAALAGCALGFLPHNFPPARIYMGDAGSLYLGFLIAYIGLKLRFDAPQGLTFLVPILVVGVPILDTTLVTIERLRHGRSPFRGGRDHISHRLVRLGLPVRGAVTLIYATGAGLGVVALVVSRVDRTAAYIISGLVFALGVVAIGALGRVAVDDDADRDASDRADR
jgi:UDP-GlcNAc:undecaprenyl-phosphate GlcNAc-1-phosphate transferase